MIFNIVIRTSSLICLSILLLGCKFAREPIDLILYNGKIISLAVGQSEKEALAIHNGVFVALGSDQEIRERYEGTREIDLKGHCVIPGINEGHVHPMLAASSEHFEEIPDVHNIKELLYWIQGLAATKPQGEWIIHPKFFATRLDEMRQPTLRELDSVAPHHPVFLNGSYGGMVNSEALRMSGINNSTSHTGFLKDEDTGDLTGIIRRSAFEKLAITGVEKLTEEERAEDMVRLLKIYNSVGITSMCAGSGSTKDLLLFRSLRDQGLLTVRVFQNILIPFEPADSRRQMESALDSLEYRTGTGDDWVKVGSLKAVLDGGVLTGTAYLREPWGLGAKNIYGITDPDYRGILRIDPEDLERIISVAHDKGWKFTAHVTGGGGVDVLLSAMENVSRSQPINDRRFSVIHGNFFNSDAISKMRELGVYADMQPAWFFKDADLLNKVLGEERLKTFHPYRSLMDGGVVINGGSDHMVKLDPNKAINPFNPFLGMWSIISRQTDRGSIFFPEEAVTRMEALKMYTINNAYASFEEDKKGSIEPGKLADVAVLSKDIFTCPEDQIKEIEAVVTIVGGEVVFDRGVLEVSHK